MISHFPEQAEDRVRSTLHEVEKTLQDLARLTLS